MGQRESHDAVTLYCKSCGELVQVAGPLEDDSRILCVRCAIGAAERAAGYGPEYWTNSSHTADEAYEPSDRERDWWRFLSWMIATGRMTVGPAEGAR